MMKDNKKQLLIQKEEIIFKGKFSFMIRMLLINSTNILWEPTSQYMLEEEEEIMKYKKKANMFFCQMVHCLVGESDTTANNVNHI